MSYRFEENEIVIDGWENGIALSPYGGISKLVNANVTDTPGEVSVELKPVVLTKPPTVSAVAFTSNITTDLITVASTTGYYNGMAIQFNTVVTSTGIVTGRVFWIGNLSGVTFKVYKSPSLDASQVVDIATGNGSGTLSSYTLGKPIDSTFGIATVKTYNMAFILDANGLAWWVANPAGTYSGDLRYLGNDTIAGGNGRAIVAFSEHLFVFRSTSVDRIGLRALADGDEDPDSAYTSDSIGGWQYGLVTPTTLDFERVRVTLVGQDDFLYFDNSGRNVGSLSTAFVLNGSAIDLPIEEYPSTLTLSELGTNLLVGGDRGKIYPWDRISSSFNSPILLSERVIHKMISTQSETYIFVGDRGRIYRTNSSFAEEWFKIPDHITGKVKPIFTINDVEINRNELYFSFTATDNGGTAISDKNLDGVWAINLTTKAFRNLQTSSHATEGKVHIIMENPYTDAKEGSGLIVGWENSTGGYGVDIGSNDPYSGGETIVDSDIIPIGTNKFPNTIKEIEFKLGKPLVSGESIELQQRSNLNTSFTSIDSTNTVGVISASYDADFENVEWLQIRAILTSTATTPSFVPLREIRIKP